MPTPVQRGRAFRLLLAVFAAMLVMPAPTRRTAHGVSALTKIPRGRRGVAPWNQGGAAPSRKRIRAVRRTQ